MCLWLYRACGLVAGTGGTDLRERERGQDSFKDGFRVLKEFQRCMMEGFQREVRLTESLGFGWVGTEGKGHEQRLRVEMVFT